jgi:hypothetical protein
VALVEELRDGIKENAPATMTESDKGILAGGMTAVNLLLRALNSPAPHDDNEGDA